MHILFTIYFIFILVFIFIIICCCVNTLTSIKLSTAKKNLIWFIFFIFFILFYHFIAVKWLIAINRIQNKHFCICSMCVCVCVCVCIYYVCINTHPYMNIFRQNIMFIY